MFRQRRIIIHEAEDDVKRFPLPSNSLANQIANRFSA